MQRWKALVQRPSGPIKMRKEAQALQEKGGRNTLIKVGNVLGERIFFNQPKSSKNIAFHS
jgi:hypothetical protein